MSVAAVIDGSKRVFIVPDGMLNLVSFHSLPDGDSGYLIESDPLIHFLSSERDLASVAAQDGKGLGLLAIGGPDFDERGHFAALKTSLETSTSDQGEDATTTAAYRGSRATCGNFKTTRFIRLSGALRRARVARGWGRGVPAMAAGV